MVTSNFSIYVIIYYIPGLNHTLFILILIILIIIIIKRILRRRKFQYLDLKKNFKSIFFLNFS